MDPNPTPMKTRAIAILLVTMAAGVSYLDMRAQTPTKPTVPPLPPAAEKLAYPYGKECVVTLDPQATRTSVTAGASDPAGFQADGTLRGELIYLADEWCVLKDGTFENWIPRNKILTMRGPLRTDRRSPPSR